MTDKIPKLSKREWKLLQRFGNGPIDIRTLGALDRRALKKLAKRGLVEHASLEEVLDHLNDAGEVLNEDAEHKHGYWHYYGKTILTSVATFCCGIICRSLFNALGLGGLLIGLLLSLLVFLALYVRL